jgi:hypothetical protein
MKVVLGWELSEVLLHRKHRPGAIMLSLPWKAVILSNATLS